MNLYCTYCWRLHTSPSLDHWIKHNQTGCGKERHRYLLTKEDYLAYIAAYKAAEYQHPEPTKPTQLSLF